MARMPYISISLSNDELKQLEALCKEEHRGKSSMFKHMMAEYIKSKDEN